MIIEKKTTVKMLDVESRILANALDLVRALRKNLDETMHSEDWEMYSETTGECIQSDEMARFLGMLDFFANYSEFTVY